MRWEVDILNSHSCCTYDSLEKTASDFMHFQQASSSFDESGTYLLHYHLANSSKESPSRFNQILVSQWTSSSPMSLCTINQCILQLRFALVRLLIEPLRLGYEGSPDSAKLSSVATVYIRRITGTLVEVYCGCWITLKIISWRNLPATLAIRGIITGCDFTPGAQEDRLSWGVSWEYAVLICLWLPGRN